MNSDRHIKAEDAWDVIESFFEGGFTDGLPVVPPRSDLVDAALDPDSKIPEYKVCAVRLDPAGGKDSVC